MENNKNNVSFRISDVMRNKSFIGVRLVEARPMTNAAFARMEGDVFADLMKAEEGYCVTLPNKQVWMPKEEFEAEFIQVGSTEVSDEDVRKIWSAFNHPAPEDARSEESAMVFWRNIIHFIVQWGKRTNEKLLGL